MLKMQKSKELIAKVLADVCLLAAKHASNSTSFFGAYQPKEPDELDERLAAMKKK